MKTQNITAANDNAQTFDQALEMWLDRAQILTSDAEGPSFPENCRTILVIGKGGRKFVRIVQTDPTGSRNSVHCFIEKTTGNVLKAAGWKGPAKGVRGNIFGDNLGVGPHGAVYFV